MDEWGFDGPVFGPYKYFHTTYACTVKMGRDNDEVDELAIIDDLLYYDGKYYGDWSVYENPEKSPIEKFDPSKAQPPKTEKRQAKIIVYIKGGVCQEVKTNIQDNSWEYAVVDYDNEPDLPDDYVPFSDEEMKPFL